MLRKGAWSCSPDTSSTDELLVAHRTKLDFIPKICRWTCCHTHTPLERTFTNLGTSEHAKKHMCSLLVHVGKHTHAHTCTSHCFPVSFKLRDLSCRTEIITTGRNGLKCCLKTYNSLLCRTNSGPAFLSLFTSLLQESEGKLTCEWNKQTCICIGTISKPRGGILWRKPGVHISLKAELQCTFQKGNKPWLLPISRWLKYVSFSKVFNHTSD